MAASSGTDCHRLHKRPIAPRGHVDNCAPRQLAGGRWYVEATWVDGRIQHISEFETEGEARRWINDKSEAYDWINHKSEAYFTGMGDPDVAGP
jgi:hypothetical protein